MTGDHRDHDHPESGHGSVSHRDASHAALPHDSAPPEPRRLLPPGPLLARGVALGGGAVFALLAIRGAWRISRLLGTATAPIATIAALLLAWAAAIHLTGGEKFDDHPWV